MQLPTRPGTLAEPHNPEVLVLTTAPPAGHSAFIASYWSLFDDAAHGFAKGLDQRLFAGRSIGEAAVGTDDDPLTWLTSTVYAYPLAAAAKRPDAPA